MAKKRLNKGEIGERIALAIAQSGRRAKDIAGALGVTMDELYTGKRSVGKFPDKLRQIIKESGKTQKAVAREAGITEVTLSRWVKGQRTPRQEDFAKLARVLPVTLEMLKESAEDREPEEGRQELSAEESLERLREALRFVADFIEQKR